MRHWIACTAVATATVNAVVGSAASPCAPVRPTPPLLSAPRAPASGAQPGSTPTGAAAAAAGSRPSLYWPLLLLLPWCTLSRACCCFDCCCRPSRTACLSKVRCRGVSGLLQRGWLTLEIHLQQHAMKVFAVSVCMLHKSGCLHRLQAYFFTTRSRGKDNGFQVGVAVKMQVLFAGKRPQGDRRIIHPTAQGFGLRCFGDQHCMQ